MKTYQEALQAIRDAVDSFTDLDLEELLSECATTDEQDASLRREYNLMRQTAKQDAFGRGRGGDVMTKRSMYFVVPAPGYYGDSDRVLSSHRTLRAARRQLRRGLEVREGRFVRGDRWLRVYAETYPLVARWSDEPAE